MKEKNPHRCPEYLEMLNEIGAVLEKYSPKIKAGEQVSALCTALVAFVRTASQCPDTHMLAILEDLLFKFSYTDSECACSPHAETGAKKSKKSKS